MMYIKSARVGPTFNEAVSETPIFEYHLYALEKPINLINNQAKPDIFSFLQIQCQCKRNLFLTARKVIRSKLSLKLENSAAKGLGEPFPKGIVRVYQPDLDGQLQFLGEDQIGHIPKGKEIKMTVGNAFDVVGKRIQTSFQNRSAIISEGPAIKLNLITASLKLRM